MDGVEVHKLVEFFFWVLMNRDGLKLAKKEQGQYPAILTEKA